MFSNPMITRNFFYVCLIAITVFICTVIMTVPTQAQEIVFLPMADVTEEDISYAHQTYEPNIVTCFIGEYEDILANGDPSDWYLVFGDGGIVWFTSDYETTLSCHSDGFTQIIGDDIVLVPHDMMWYKEQFNPLLQ